MDHRSLGPQNPVQRFPLCQLIHQFVQVTDLPHGCFLNVLHTDPADDSFDQCPLRIEPGSLAEERLDVALCRQLTGELLLAVARQPANDLIHLGLRAPLPLRLGDVHRIDTGEARGGNAVLCLHGDRGR